jgi:coproporphyrinogen III oxidase
MNQRQQVSAAWFELLRDQFIKELETIELDYANYYNTEPAKFERKIWQRPQGGGGQISILKGRVFEKVGVNISTVHGQLDPVFRNEVAGAENGDFFATGISFVAHPCSPLIPAAHFNTRYISTSKDWFGGGGDLTPTYPDEAESSFFHAGLQKPCDLYDPNSYAKFKQTCDEYFFLKHRNEPRGVGGIFFDHLNSQNFDADFEFLKDVGTAFLATYCAIVRNKLLTPWSDEQKNQQLLKRGRYVEFNLLYDRGTRFGLMTDGNIEAIFMSLPPSVKWL